MVVLWYFNISIPLVLYKSNISTFVPGQIIFRKPTKACVHAKVLQLHGNEPGSWAEMSMCGSDLWLNFPCFMEESA